MSLKGWVKFHRQMVDWEWYTDANTCRLFFHLVLIANHTERKWRGNLVQRGEKITSYRKLSTQLGLSTQQIRTALDKLKSTGDVTINSTNKFTRIKVVNYNLYQSKKNDNNTQNNTQDNKQITNKKQSNNNQITTNKNDKNDKNVKNDYYIGNWDWEKIRKMWNDLVEENPKILPIESITEGRKKYLKDRLEDPSNINEFEKIIEAIKKSKFLSGHKSNWCVKFDWIIKNGTNWNKVLEGQFKDEEEDNESSKKHRENRESETEKNFWNQGEAPF